MNIIIVHKYGEHNIILNPTCYDKTLYDILISDKLFINSLYNMNGKRVGFKIPLKTFNTDNLILFTKNTIYEWKEYQRKKHTKDNF